VAAVPRLPGRAWTMMAVSWHLVLLFTLPPLFDIFGRFFLLLPLLVICFSCLRFGLEPAGASCTIDYWHGNFRNYNTFAMFLVVFAYIIPICAM
jgi:hypothetical protein